MPIVDCMFAIAGPKEENKPPQWGWTLTARGAYKQL